MNNHVTNSTGAGLIISAVIDLVYHAIILKQVSPNAQADVQAIIGGVGLLFAKDWNVTGGTKKQ